MVWETEIGGEGDLRGDLTFYGEKRYSGGGDSVSYGERSRCHTSLFSYVKMYK